MVKFSFTNYVVVGPKPVEVDQISDIAFVSNKQFVDI